MNANINRRAFLKASGAATGGLLVAVYLPDVAGAIAPAVGNAIFAATGKRVRRLPFSLEKLV